MVTAFFAWLWRGLFGSRLFEECDSQVIKSEVGRLYFLVQRRYFRRDRGWLRQPQYWAGVPTVLACFNVCGWSKRYFHICCHNLEHTNWVTASGNPQMRIYWRYFSTLRHRDDAVEAWGFLSNMRWMLDDQPVLAGGPFRADELSALSVLRDFLKEVPCPDPVSI